MSSSFIQKCLRWLGDSFKMYLCDTKAIQDKHLAAFQSASSEVVLCPILYCRDVFSNYLGKILDFVVVHWSFIFVSHVSRLIVEFI